jgi:hypothetical protein
MAERSSVDLQQDPRAIIATRMFDAPQFRTIVTFEDLGRNRTRLTLHAEFPSAAERDRVIRDHGADKGAIETLSRLGAYLATIGA